MAIGLIGVYIFEIYAVMFYVCSIDAHNEWGNDIKIENEVDNSVIIHFFYAQIRAEEYTIEVVHGGREYGKMDFPYSINAAAFNI